MIECFSAGGIEVSDSKVECYVKELDGLSVRFRVAGISGHLAHSVAHPGCRSAKRTTARKRISPHECLAHRETPLTTSSTFLSGNQACAAALFASLRDEYDRGLAPAARISRSR